MPATVTHAIISLSLNPGSDSHVTLRGTGFEKAGGSKTTVYIRYPTTGAVILEWRGDVHKNAKNKKNAEVKVKQLRAFTEDEVKGVRDTTDLVRIIVDSTALFIDVDADIYEE